MTAAMVLDGTAALSAHTREAVDAAASVVESATSEP